MNTGIIEFVSLEQVLLVKLKNVSTYYTDESFNFEPFDQNLKTLIFTFAPPLEHCALYH